MTHKDNSKTNASKIKRTALPKKQHFFVAGTDTEVGKTFITSALLLNAQQQGFECYGVKPVTAGCTEVEKTLVSEDAQTIAQYSSKKIHEDLIAPIKLTTPCSPNISASIDDKHITASRVTGMVRGALSKRASHVLVEGSGGWYAPINDRETMADVAKELGLPVILVVGIKLGCLNHALLTLKAMQANHITLAGWVANETTENTAFFEEQVQTLTTFFPVPNLGVVRFGDIQQASQSLSWPQSVKDPA